MLSLQQQHIIKQTLNRFDPLKIGIFGSYARNQQTINSDIDILVTFGKRVSLFDLIEMEDQLSEQLKCDVDLITERSVHQHLKSTSKKTFN